MKNAAESYISAIRSQQAQMTDELEDMFSKDLLPVQVIVQSHNFLHGDGGWYIALHQ